MKYIVYVNGTHHAVIPETQDNVETQESIENSGFVKVWDSAPDEFEGALYAARTYGAINPVNYK